MNVCRGYELYYARVVLSNEQSYCKVNNGANCVRARVCHTRALRRIWFRTWLRHILGNIFVEM